MNISSIIIERIKTYYNLSQREIAEKFSVGYSTITDWKKGKNDKLPVSLLFHAFGDEIDVSGQDDD